MNPHGSHMLNQHSKAHFCNSFTMGFRFQHGGWHRGEHSEQSLWRLWGDCQEEVLEETSVEEAWYQGVPVWGVSSASGRQGKVPES